MCNTTQGKMQSSVFQAWNARLSSFCTGLGYWSCFSQSTSALRLCWQVLRLELHAAHFAKHGSDHEGDLLHHVVIHDRGLCPSDSAVAPAVPEGIGTQGRRRDPLPRQGFGDQGLVTKNKKQEELNLVDHGKTTGSFSRKP